MVAHHTVGGCNLRTEDLFGTGTGTLLDPIPAGAGSLLELSQGGKVPYLLANGESNAIGAFDFASELKLQQCDHIWHAFSGNLQTLLLP